MIKSVPCSYMWKTLPCPFPLAPFFTEGTQSSQGVERPGLTLTATAPQARGRGGKGEGAVPGACRFKRSHQPWLPMEGEAAGEIVAQM